MFAHEIYMVAPDERPLLEKEEEMWCWNFQKVSRVWCFHCVSFRRFDCFASLSLHLQGVWQRLSATGFDNKKLFKKEIFDIRGCFCTIHVY